MQIKIKIKGQKVALKSLKDAERKLVLHAYNKALEDLGNFIGDLAEPKVPVMEGLLKASFTVRKIGNKWVCGYNKEYAAYQEFGKRRDGSHVIKNRPGGGKKFFLTGTIRENKDKLLAFLQKRFDYHFFK